MGSRRTKKESDRMHCADCGNMFPADELMPWRYERAWLCQDCTDERDREDEEDTEEMNRKQEDC